MRGGQVDLSMSSPLCPYPRSKGPAFWKENTVSLQQCVQWRIFLSSSSNRAALFYTLLYTSF